MEITATPPHRPHILLTLACKARFLHLLQLSQQPWEAPRGAFSSHFAERKMRSSRTGLKPQLTTPGESLSTCLGWGAGWREKAKG